MNLEMNRFFFKLLLFLFPITIGLVCIEIFYRTVPNNYTSKSNYLKTHSSQIEVLFFGDSHCMYGLNPDYFALHAFNLGNVSQTIYFDKLLFDKYVDLPNLKKVIFCIEYTNLSQMDNSQDDVYRKYYYQSYMDVEVSIISKFDIGRYSLVFAQSYERTKHLLKRYLKTGNLVDCNANGWGNNYKKRDRTSPNTIAKSRAAIQEDGLMNFKVNTERLQQIINICKQKNIQILIVSMPQTRLFESYLNPKKLKKIIETCTGLQNKNNQNVHYLNLFHDKRFENADFYDADHLNDYGAMKCSKIVNLYLNQIHVKK